MRVLVSIPLSPFTGYGNDGIGLCRALIRAGHDVHVIPDHVQAPLPEDVALLLTKPVTGEFDLSIVHLGPGSMKAYPDMKAVSKTLIGWTMWEWSDFAREPEAKNFQKNFELFDAIVTYDEVSRDALRPYFDGPMPIVQGGFMPEDWPTMERDYFEDHLYFCMVGVLTSRKNPFAAIRAIAELKEEHPEEMECVRLSLKTTSLGLHPKMEEAWPWLRIYFQEWSQETLKNFYASQHVLLAPSRGEGKNMPALEFQSTGGVVVASSVGGHKQWLNPDYNYPVPVTMESDDREYPTSLDATIDHDAFKATILDIVRNRQQAADKGKLAASVIPAQCNWDAVLVRLFDRLAETTPGGDIVKMKAAMTRANG